MKFKFLINRFMELGFLLFCLIVNSCSKSDYFFNKTSNKHTQENHIPQRIISLSPSATEILFAIGAQNQIAARSDFCDFPENAKNIPSVGGFDGKTLSIEKILSFSPDFVYLTNGMHNYLIPFLQIQKLEKSQTTNSNRKNFAIKLNKICKKSLNKINQNQK